MIRFNKAIAGAALLASLSSVDAADITGKVTLKGTPPAELPIPLDATCGKLWPNEKPTTHFYTVGPDHGLGDVLVYLRGANLKSDPPAKPAVLDQKGCEYVPQMMGLQMGQKLLIRNSDPVLHNIHRTPPKGNPEAEFNVAQIAGGRDIEKAFDKPEVVVRFKCDVHLWMFSYAGVFPHSFFAVSDKEGKFKIEGVPPGKYTLVAFHRKAHGNEEKALTQEVTVTDSGATANFTVEVPAQ